MTEKGRAAGTVGFPDLREGEIGLVFATVIARKNHGQNSDIRYNFFYPRWAYDDYRALLGSQAAARGWPYADLWDAVDNDQFTDSLIDLGGP